MGTPLQVGITGGIGTGKTLVCKIFASLGTPVYDADSRAKILMTTDRILVNQIQKEFGNLSYNENGSLNKGHLIKAFGDPSHLDKLNKLVHPRVAHDYEEWKGQQAEAAYTIKEAALLIESGSVDSLDKLVVITAPLNLRIARILSRDPHRTKEEIQRIMDNQLSEQEKLDRADYIVVNDETELVIPQVLELHKRFLLMN